MTAIKSDIEGWLATAKIKGATHLIIAVDKYDYDNYPVYVGPDEDVREEEERIISQSMQGVDEVYSMSMDIDKQLSQVRAFNYD